MPSRARHINNDCDASLHPAVAAAAGIAQHSPLPTLVTHNLTPDNPVVFANDAFIDMTRAQREAVLNLPVMSLVNGPADCDVSSRLESALVNGRGGSWPIRLKPTDGDPVTTVAYLAPLCDPAGRVVGHNINLADPAAAGTTIRDRARFYTGIYDEAPGFIAVSSGENHVIEYANASYRSFVKREHLIGRTVAEALPEIAEQGFLTLLDEVYRTGVPFRGTDLPISICDEASGTRHSRWIDVLYQPMRDANGAIIGLFCEGYDVTELHQISRTLVELELKMIHVSRVNAMGTMAATLAHELNQPLTAISNYLAGVQSQGEAVPDISRLTEALDGIGEASQRASAIIDHLRQLIRHRKPNREPFDLRAAVDECVRLIRCTCRSDIVFENRIESGVTMIADRVKIQQVLINLLQNASEAMADSPRDLITISAIEDECGLTVCIADSGPGVSPEARATMFSWTSTGKDDGMGIGLSICRTIVELYAGRIWLETSGPQGAEFRFLVPWPRRTEPEGQAGTAGAN